MENTSTQISTAIIDDAEKWLKENIRDFSLDNFCAVYPKTINEDFSINLCDEEEDDKCKIITLAEQVEALCELVNRLTSGRLFVGGFSRSAVGIDDTSNWDVEVWDAFFQLCYHKDVIYG